VKAKVPSPTPSKPGPPAVSEPAPAPVPEPVRGPDALARIEFDGSSAGYTVELVQGGHRVPIPASVAPGTYELVYGIPGTPSVSLGTIQMYGNDTRRVHCSATMKVCNLR
jgi:hypothetical protein